MASLSVIPAAGRAERFGAPKLLADIGGKPLLHHTLRSVLEAGVARVVLVAAPGASFTEVELARDARVALVTNPDPSRGMFSSIQAGLGAAEGHPIVVLPADMPFVRPDTVAALLDECRRIGEPVVPVLGGRRGHPLVLPGWMREALLSADAATTLKRALAAVGQPVEVPVEDTGVVRDVDTPDDLGRRLEP